MNRLVHRRLSEVHMFTAYIAVTILAAAASLFSAGTDFVGATVTHLRGHFYAFAPPVSSLFVGRVRCRGGVVVDWPRSRSTSRGAGRGFIRRPGDRPYGCRW